MKSSINLTGDSALSQFAKFAPTDAGAVTESGNQDNTPVATKGFGAREDADATRQAQHMEANDAPVDVNMNAALAREQAGTLNLTGKQFAMAAARLESVDNSNVDWREMQKHKIIGPK